MKLCTIITIGLFCILVVGCEETVVETGPDKHLMNSELINSYNDMAVENAIISQHTLFPYHFVKNGAELNELGQKDFGVLAKHFAEHPGHLNIRRENGSAELYRARIGFVLDSLKEAGIMPERINISDGMPGGDGMPSERVLVILEDSYEASSLGTSTREYENK